MDVHIIIIVFSSLAKRIDGVGGQRLIRLARVHNLRRRWRKRFPF